MNYKETIWGADLLKMSALVLIGYIVDLHGYIQFAKAHDSEDIVKKEMKLHDMMLDALAEKRATYRTHGSIAGEINKTLREYRKYYPTTYWLHN